MLTDENRELRLLLQTEHKNATLMKENMDNLKKDQVKLVKNNKQLRRDVATLSKGTKLTEEIISRAQRYRKERDLLADEVERLRAKVGDLQIEGGMTGKNSDPKIIRKRDVIPQAKLNVVKLSRVDAFAPTTVGQLATGMMVKFIGHTQRFDDVSPVQEGIIEEIKVELDPIEVI